jgi:hypothetical protein
MLVGALDLPISESRGTRFADALTSGTESFYPDNYVEADRTLGHNPGDRPTGVLAVLLDGEPAPSNHPDGVLGVAAP